MVKDDWDGRRPLFIDLDTGIIGTFAGYDSASAEAKHVRVRFVPLNKLIPMVHTTSYTIPRNKIYKVVNVKRADDIGQEQEIYYAFQGDAETSNFVSQIMEKVQKENEDLTNLVEQLRKQISTLKTENSDLAGSQAEMMKRIQDAKGKSESNQNTPGIPQRGNPFGEF